MTTEFSFDTTTGPNMQGTWVNPKNGDYFTVRETFFQDNNLMVQTMDGRLLDYNFISDYIKCDVKEAKRISENVKSKSNNKELEVPTEIKSIIENEANPESGSEYDEYMIPEDANLFNKGDNIFKKSLSTPSPAPVIPGSEDMIFIKRALGKTIGPKIKVSIDWPDFPTQKIDMLTTLLDVSNESIAGWYIKDIDADSIKKEVQQSIEKYIKKVNTQPKSVTSQKRVETAPTTKPKARTTQKTAK